ncbi:MAG: PilZ domain-containing protein [Candidatus Aminicenantes bacterium]|nr:PilZ domain-containing protein [Candidatus Aminicenantes bacterium]
MDNKREAKRLREENKLYFEILSSPKQFEYKKLFYTFTKDISLKGISVRTDTFLPIGTIVEIKIDLRKLSKMIAIKAKVRWVKSLFQDELFKVGLEFIDTAPEVIQLLIEDIYGKY